MEHVLKAVRYRSLDEARRLLGQVSASWDDPFDDGGEEPQGLLSVIVEDLVPEELFYRLFELKTGTLIEVERIPYSGFGPPAEEEDYMGFVSGQFAYVVRGRRIRIEIEECPRGARDIHHLEALVLSEEHALNREGLARRLGLPARWDFDDLFDLIAAGQTTGDEIDRMIHCTEGE